MSINIASRWPASEVNNAHSIDIIRVLGLCLCVLCLQFPGDGVVTGHGCINGRLAFVFSQVLYNKTVLGEGVVKSGFDHTKSITCFTDSPKFDLGGQQKYI